MLLNAPNRHLTEVQRATSRKHEQQPIDHRRRRLLGAALLLAAPSAAVRAAQATVPPAKFQELDQIWYDPERARPVPAKIYWPDSGPDSLTPLVVFSHGLGSSRSDYSYLGKHWASNGWASMHVQHVGSDSAVWKGNPFHLMDRIREAVTEQEAIHRVRDVHFALDQFQGSHIGAAVDPARIVMAGHSFGANTALLAVGARVMRGRAWR
jgi:predicted dienelactone hydrolase